MTIRPVGFSKRGMNLKTPARVIALLALAPLAARGAQPPCNPAYFQTGILDYNSRVCAQERIDRVYWSHRTWPGDNPALKPDFESTVSTQDLRNAVDTYLQKSQALSVNDSAITSAELQTELDRMVA